MNRGAILHWFADSWINEIMQGVPWLFPAFEIVHFVGLCLLFGAVLVMDLRLLGFIRIVPIPAALQMIPIAIVGLIINLISGVAFFCSNPLNYWDNWGFWLKMILVVFGGLNALWFELAERRKVLSYPEGADVAVSVKVIAGLSLLTWLCVLTLGRLLPFLAVSSN